MNKNNVHGIVDSSGRSIGLIFNGDIIETSEVKNYNKSIFFDNENFNEKDLDSYAELICEEFTSKNLATSFWIKLKKKSYSNSNIISCRNGDRESGIFLRDGETNEIGIRWNENKKTSSTGTNVFLEIGVWTHIIFSFESDGYIKVFKNGIFMNEIDLEKRLNNFMVSKFKIGGFCGEIDNVYVYPMPIDYGNVKLGQDAQNNVSYLYRQNRITEELNDVEFYDIEDSDEFYYYQTKQYHQAYENYRLAKKLNHTYYDKNSKYPISGGVNDGKLKVADGSFRTFNGKIISELI